QAAARTGARSTVLGEPFDDRRQLAEVVRFGVRRRIGGPAMKAPSVPPDGPQPELRGALHIGYEGVPDVDYVLRPDPERFEGRLEDPGTRLVRLCGLRRDDGIESQSITLEDIQEEFVVCIGDDGARHAIEGFEDPRDFGVGFRLPPQRHEPVHVWRGRCVDILYAERLRDAVLRALCHGEW